MKSKNAKASMCLILGCILGGAINLQASENYLRAGLEYTVRAEYMGSSGEESFDAYYILEDGLVTGGEEILVVKNRSTGRESSCLAIRSA